MLVFIYITLRIFIYSHDQGTMSQIKRKRSPISPSSIVSRGIVLVDMDNTIVDYSASIVIGLREKYPDANITRENWQTLQLNDLHYNRKIIQSQPQFFKNLKPLHGAFEALKEMEREGYCVFIVSSPSISGTTCHSDKCEWVKQHFGDKWAKKLVLTKDKTIVMGDVLIDDKPFITGAIDRPTWKHITFAQPYNIHLREADRVFLHDWSKWKEALTQVVFNK